MNERVFGDKFANNILKVLNTAGYDLQSLSDNQLNRLINEVMENIYNDYINDLSNLNSLGYNISKMETSEVVDKIIKHSFESNDIN